MKCPTCREPMQVSAGVLSCGECGYSVRTFQPVDIGTPPPEVKPVEILPEHLEGIKPRKAYSSRKHGKMFVCRCCSVEGMRRTGTQRDCLSCQETIPEKLRKAHRVERWSPRPADNASRSWASINAATRLLALAGRRKVA